MLWLLNMPSLIQTTFDVVIMKRPQFHLYLYSHIYNTEKVLSPIPAILHPLDFMLTSRTSLACPLNVSDVTSTLDANMAKIGITRWMFLDKILSYFHQWIHGFTCIDTVLNLGQALLGNRQFLALDTKPHFGPALCPCYWKTCFTKLLKAKVFISYRKNAFDEPLL